MVPLKESSTQANAFLSLGKALNLSSFFSLAPWRSHATASVWCNAQQHPKASLTWCLNGIRGWLYWKVKGEKDTSIVPGLFFMLCSVYLSPIVPEGQRQFLHCLMVSYILPSITDYWAELPHPQLAGWARHPTAEEHLHLLLERGSLNNEFQVWKNLLKQTGKRNFIYFISSFWSYFSKLLDQVGHPKGYIAGQECHWKSSVARQFPPWWSKQVFSVTE